VTGTLSSVAQGNQPYDIILGTASSTDPNYNNTTPADVPVTNTDVNHAGYNINPTSGLTTTDVGGTATFTVDLTSQPTGNVTIPISSSNTAEGTTNVSSLTFTPANWNVPQTVTIMGTPSSTIQGNQPYDIILGAASSTDPSYNNTAPSGTVSVTNLDVNHGGYTISSTNLTVSATGPLESFTVALNSQPTSNVIVPFAVTDTRAALISQTSLVFTPANWNIPQTIYVRGLDDHIATGNLPFVIIPEPAQSLDSAYNGVGGPLIHGIDLKPDTVGIDATPIVGSISDNGAQATFSVVLTSKPTGNVVIPLAMSRPDLGILSSSTITFTPNDWNIPHTVTIKGIDDHLNDGTQTYSITLRAASSSDTTGYNGLTVTPTTLTGTSLNNNISAFVSHINGSGYPDTIGSGGAPMPGVLETNVNHTMANFDIKLTSKPTSNVYISFSDPPPGVILNSIIVFTPQNWNVPQLVSVQGTNVAGSYTVIGRATSADPHYNNILTHTYSAQNDGVVTMTNKPDIQGNLVTTSLGGTGSFDAKLGAKPTSNVFITFHSTNAAEGKVLNNIIEFTPYNWYIPQLVSVRGTVNKTAISNVLYDIVGITTSRDVQYNGLITDVKAINNGAGALHINVTAPSSPFTTNGQSTIVGYFLPIKPTASVTVHLSISNPSEGFLTRTTLVFTPANWNIPQYVRVTGEVGTTQTNHPYYLITSPSISADPRYNGLITQAVKLINIDTCPTS
jgi:hypothetical protein